MNCVDTYPLNPSRNSGSLQPPVQLCQCGPQQLHSPFIPPATAAYASSRRDHQRHQPPQSSTSSVRHLPNPPPLDHAEHGVLLPRAQAHLRLLTLLAQAILLADVTAVRFRLVGWRRHERATQWQQRQVEAAAATHWAGARRGAHAGGHQQLLLLQPRGHEAHAPGDKATYSNCDVDGHSPDHL